MRPSAPAGGLFLWVQQRIAGMPQLIVIRILLSAATLHNYLK
jgi:hypothetical protein